MEVSVRELKNHLSEFLRKVQAGEHLLITSRGRPVAHLTPVASTAPSEDEAIERLRAMPWVQSGAGGKIRRSRKPIPWPPGEKTLAELVMEDRE